MSDNATTSGRAPVAIFIEDLGGGGAEKISVTLANALAARGHAVDLLMWRAEGPYLADVAPAVRRIDLSSGSMAGKLRVVRLLAEYLRDDRPRALLTQLEKPSLLAIVAAQLAGYRRVVPCVHVDFSGYAQLDHRLRRMLLKGLVAVFYRRVARIVAVSQGAALSVRRLVSSRGPGVSVIYNGFDFQALQESAAKPVAHGWLHDKTIPVIIACGRLVPQKAHDVLLRAFANLRQERRARLIILGEGLLRATLLSLAAQLGVGDDLLLPGFVENPAAWFAKSDLFVLSSRNEGLSNVLVEALGVGIPVVSTDCPSGPREVLDDGRLGRLVPVDDPQALTDAMRAALRDGPCPENGGLSHYLQNFSVEKMAADYETVITEVEAARG